MSKSKDVLRFAGESDEPVSAEEEARAEIVSDCLLRCAAMIELISTVASTLPGSLGAAFTAAGRLANETGRWHALAGASMSMDAVARVLAQAAAAAEEVARDDSGLGELSNDPEYAAVAANVRVHVIRGLIRAFEVEAERLDEFTERLLEEDEDEDEVVVTSFAYPTPNGSGGN